MKNINKKIVGKIVCVVSAISIVGTVALLSEKKRTDDVINVSSKYSSNTPIIVLDAGHGGMDGGCSTAEGQTEKGVNLNILLKLRDMLEVSGYDVEVTRDTDISIHDKGVEGIANQKSSDMDNRLEIFNKHENAICISIHQNLFTDPKYSGAQMFYSDNNELSESLAATLQGNFIELIQPENQREIKLCGKELFLCYYSENPTVMVECGFLSNPEEAALLMTDEYQTKVAFTIFSGINEFMSEQK